MSITKGQIPRMGAATGRSRFGMRKVGDACNLCYPSRRHHAITFLFVLLLLSRLLVLVLLRLLVTMVLLLVQFVFLLFFFSCSCRRHPKWWPLSLSLSFVVVVAVAVVVVVVVVPRLRDYTCWLSLMASRRPSILTPLRRARSPSIEAPSSASVYLAHFVESALWKGQLYLFLLHLSTLQLQKKQAPS